MSGKSTHLKVICQCGAKFRAKRKNVGKRTRCPKCKSPLVIPNTHAVQQTAEKSVETCPNCSATWEPEAMLCLECGYHKEKGEQIRAKVGRTIRVGQHISLQQCSDRLLFTQSKLNKVLVLTIAFVVLNITVLLLWGDAFAQWARLLSYLVLAAVVLGVVLFNLKSKKLWVRKKVEVLEVTLEFLTLRNGWRWSACSIPIDQVSQIFVRRKDIGEESVNFVFEIFALTKQGRRYRLLRMEDLDSALRVEEMIEDFLGIEDDEEVPKFAAPRTQLAIQGLCWIAGGLVSLSMVPSNLKFDRDMETGLGLAVLGLVLFGYGAWKVNVALTEDRELVEEDLQS